MTLSWGHIITSLCYAIRTYCNLHILHCCTVAFLHCLRLAIRECHNIYGMQEIRFANHIPCMTHILHPMSVATHTRRMRDTPFRSLIPISGQVDTHVIPLHPVTPLIPIAPQYVTRSFAPWNIHPARHHGEGLQPVDFMRHLKSAALNPVTKR